MKDERGAAQAFETLDADNKDHVIAGFVAVMRRADEARHAIFQQRHSVRADAARKT